MNLRQQQEEMQRRWQTKTQKRYAKLRSEIEKHGIRKRELRGPPTDASKLRFIPIKQKQFWSKVEKTETCWIWKGPKAAHGYGQFSVAGNVHVMAHRYSVELIVGEKIPTCMHVHHVCRNILCVNPEHLKVLTPLDHKQEHTCQQ